MVDMQPVLVKPKGNGISQVIMQGRPLGYFKYGENNDQYNGKSKKIIKKSIANLQEKYEYIIMEGAGSPAEINK